MEISTVVNIILSVLSFILAVVSIITVIISIRQNKRLLEANEQQINEMRKEHQLSVQPVLALENGEFAIERPKFYYTPPQDSYSFLSRYLYRVILKNVSSATAIFVDISATLLLEKDGQELSLGATAVRKNILQSGQESEGVHILFSGDDSAYLYSALRESKTSQLPKIEISIVYRNTCGGYFSCEQTFILVPTKNDITVIRNWHKAIIEASVEIKEIIGTLERILDDDKWEAKFGEAKNMLDKRLGEEERFEVAIQLVEIPEKYCFRVLSESEYNDIVGEFSYPRFIHNGVPCCKE